LEETIIKSIEQVIQEYHARGFKVEYILGNGQFKHVKQIIEAIGINRNVMIHKNCQRKIWVTPWLFVEMEI